ncbi:MAG TPA: cobalamin biosynthesis protein, partial [Alphaproteobacteria bacterium]
MIDPWITEHLTPDLSRLTAPVSLIVFIMIIDGLSRLVPAIRDHLRPLLGIPFSFFNGLQQKLARSSRSSADLHRRGVIAVLLIVGLGIVLAYICERLGMQSRHFATVIWFTVWRWSVGWTIARDIMALPKPDARQGHVVFARRKMPVFTNLPDQADTATVYRVTIEALALTLVHGLFAPLTYALIFAVFGYAPLYGAVLGVMGTALAEVRPTDATQRQFQTLAQSIGNGILFLPSRIAGFVLILAALFTPKANILTGFTRMIRQGHLYSVFSLGWVMAAISGIFGIAFQTTGQDWLGGNNATARIEKTMLARVLWLHVVTVLMVVLILCAVMLLSIY